MRANRQRKTATALSKQHHAKLENKKTYEKILQKIVSIKATSCIHMRHCIYTVLLESSRPLSQHHIAWLPSDPELAIICKLLPSSLLVINCPGCKASNQLNSAELVSVAFSIIAFAIIRLWLGRKPPLKCKMFTIIIKIH